MKELRGRRLEQRHLRSGNFATETGTLGLGLVDDRRVRDKVGLGLPLLPEAVHRHLGRKFGIESDKVWIECNKVWIESNSQQRGDGPVG